MMLHLSILFLCFFAVTFAADDSALVTNLPGLSSQPAFRHYSGYLQASSTNRLHYWFVESQRNPQTDPFVLWLNGGPGCSSLDGLLSENGPFRLQDNLTLRYNPYSWNMEANVLYLESPAGVGFSYASDGNVSTDDDKVARENYNSLVDFFKKFPEFKRNPFFVTGESYGGIYIPTLTVLLLKDGSFNLTGIAVGNGLSSYRYNDASSLHFYYYHGLFGEKTWYSLLSSCNCTDKTRCFFGDDKSIACQTAISNAAGAIRGLNIYNLYGPCYNPRASGDEIVYGDLGNLFRSNIYIARERSVAKSSAMKLSKVKRVRMAPSCVNDTAARIYLNMASVRSALHIPSHVQRWDLCSDDVSFNYKRVYQEMSAQYKIIMKSKTRVLIYNGDIDMACNFLGDEWFFDDLKYPVDYSSKQWHVRTDSGPQVGGVSKSFANGQLVFTTVRGAGHMVPSDRPMPAFYMISVFLKNRQL